MHVAQVLLACVRCPMGNLLTNSNVIDIFQACFRIGHYQTEKSKGMSGEHRLLTCCCVLRQMRLNRIEDCLTQTLPYSRLAS